MYENPHIIIICGAYCVVYKEMSTESGFGTRAKDLIRHTCAHVQKSPLNVKKKTEDDWKIVSRTTFATIISS